MTYVGAVPTTGDFKLLDSITTSSTTTFNLRQGGVAVYPQSANHCIVSLNGVIQAPVDAFTIVNDTIVFASSLASSDVINFILVLGNVNDIGVPSSGSVGISQLSASGTKDATTFLRGDNTFAAAGTTINNNADNRVITGSGTANTLEGESNLTYDGTTFQLSQASPILKILPTTNGNDGVLEICGRSTDGSPTENRTQIKGEAEGSTANTKMTFHVENASGVNERMMISSGGRVGIGQSSPDAFLQVDHSEAAVNSARIRNSNSDISAGLLRVDATSDSGGSYRLAEFCRESNTKLEIQNDGDVNNQNGTYGTISDIRVKENIVDANSQWNDIKALKIKNYNLKIDANAPKQLGVIAQDLEASGMSGLVKETKPEKHHADIDSVFGSVDSEGNFTEGEMVKTVKTSILYMKAIKCLQEAQTKIESLEARVKTLEDA